MTTLDELEEISLDLSPRKSKHSRRLTAAGKKYFTKCRQRGREKVAGTSLASRVRRSLIHRQNIPITLAKFKTE